MPKNARCASLFYIQRDHGILILSKIKKKARKSGQKGQYKICALLGSVSTESIVPRTVK